MTDKTGPPGLPFWTRAEVIRTEAGMSKTDLAKAAGIARRTYDRLEWQEKPAWPKTVHKIADALGIPRPEAVRLAGLHAAAVVEEAAAETTADVEMDAELSALEERLAQLLARIPERRRQQLEQIHADERQRFENRVARVRADYERSVVQLEKLAHLDVQQARGEGEGDDDDEADNFHILEKRP